MAQETPLPAVEPVSGSVTYVFFAALNTSRRKTFFKIGAMPAAGLTVNADSRFSRYFLCHPFGTPNPF